MGEVKYLVNVIWEFNPNWHCNSALKKLEQNTDGVVTVMEFVLLNRHHPDILQPLRHVKKVMRKKTVYTRFWTQIMHRRVADFPMKSMFELCDKLDPAYVASSLEYLNLRTDIVPPQYIEHWQFIQKRKAARGTMHQQLPFEILEILKPHPLNIHTKKTLRSVARGMTIFARARTKSKSSTARSNQVVADGDTNHEVNEKGDGNQVNNDNNKNASDQDDSGERTDDVLGVGLDGVPMFKPKPFDDSFLGSLKVR